VFLRIVECESRKCSASRIGRGASSNDGENFSETLQADEREKLRTSLSALVTPRANDSRIDDEIQSNSDAFLEEAQKIAQEDGNEARRRVALASELAQDAANGIAGAQAGGLEGPRRISRVAA
jgi:hypothetical protein